MSRCAWSMERPCHSYKRILIYMNYTCVKYIQSTYLPLPESMVLIIPLGTTQNSVQKQPQLLCTFTSVSSYRCSLIPTGSES